MKSARPTWGFRGASKQGAAHDGRGAQREGLDNVPRVLDAPVGNGGHTQAAGQPGDVVDRARLAPPNRTHLHTGQPPWA